VSASDPDLQFHITVLDEIIKIGKLLVDSVNEAEQLLSVVPTLFLPSQAFEVFEMLHEVISRHEIKRPWRKSCRSQARHRSWSNKFTSIHTVSVRQ
jgi:hypothetical protein